MEMPEEGCAKCGGQLKLIKGPFKINMGEGITIEGDAWHCRNCQQLFPSEEMDKNLRSATADM